MRRLRARWLGVAFVLAALGAAAAAAWLAGYLSSRGLDWAAKFSEIASFVLGAGALLLPLASRIARWLPAPKLTEEQVASDVADVAATLRIQGRFEGVLAGRYVYDRLPMPVRWTPADELSSEAGRAAPGPGLAATASGFTGTFDTVLEYFRELPEPRLLILGSAGAGKTVLVTELARRLLATRKDSEPIPVIIPVTAWDPRQTSLFDWVSEQLIRIDADLAHRVRDGRSFITRAQALVDRMKVLPMLDGLDEIPEAARPMATLAINRYGWAQPLVVTCRTHEYLQIIGMAQGTPVARVAAITLLPLEPADIKGYLGPDRNGHWAKVYQRLDAKPHGASAQALANPLMLWLAWAVYSGTGRSPDELADQYRFTNAAAIEHHLLAEFVPAVYPDSKGRSAGNRLRRLLSAKSEPRRWLGFLASDKHLHSGPQARQRRQPLDLFETRDVQNVAWWRFTGGVGGFRLVSVAARGAFLGFVLWSVIQFVLQRNGNWRHGSYAGPIHFRAMFLSGPLGRSIWPTIVDLIGVAPARSRQRAFSDVTRYSGDIFRPYSPAVYFSVS